MRISSLLLIAIVAPFFGATEASAMKCTQGGTTWNCAPGSCVSGGDCNPKNPTISFSPAATARLRFCATPAARTDVGCRLVQVPDAVRLNGAGTAKPGSPGTPLASPLPGALPK